MLELLARLGAAGALACLAPDELRALGTLVRDDAAAAPGVLTPSHRATAVAAMEAIIPRTSTPGATDARTVDFLDAMLAGWFTADERERIVAGLDTLDATARSTHGRPYARLAASARLALLEPLDREAHGGAGGAAPTTLGGAAARHWFATLRMVTVIGWATSRVGMEQALGTWPLPGRYLPDAPVRLRRAASRASAEHSHGKAGR